MQLINPQKNPVIPTPDHTNVTHQEVAAGNVGAKTFTVKLGTYEPSGSSIFHVHATQEHCFYMLEGELTLVDENKNEVTAHAGEAIFVPMGEVHAAFNRGKKKCVYLACTAPIA